MAIRDELPRACSFILTGDLQTYLEVIGEMFAGTEMWEGDTDEEGWSILVDPDRCPAIALYHLAMYVGETLPAGLVEQDEAAAREWIKDAPNQRRGGNYAIFRAAQRKLTGNRLVSIRERDGAGGTVDVDRMTVTTYVAETPDPAGTEADVRSVAPWDVELVYQVLVGETWQDVSDDNPIWADVEAGAATWRDVYTRLAGDSTFERPRP
jgi:hypothetical protein